MPFTSQRFIDTRTGEIVVQVPISQIAHFEEYLGPLQAGDFACNECSNIFDDNPGNPTCKTCEDWLVTA